MTAPVITISCPSCGAKVPAGKPGTTVQCEYCHTDLTLPDVSGKRERVVERIIERVPEEPAEASKGEPLKPSFYVWAVALLFLITLAAAIPLCREPTSSSADTTSPPPRSPETQKALDEAECLTRCGDKCEGQPPMQLGDCLEKCTNVCQKPR